MTQEQIDEAHQAWTDINVNMQSIFDIAHKCGVTALSKFKFKEDMKKIEAALNIAKQMEWQPVDMSNIPQGRWVMLYAHDCVFQACWHADGYWSSYDNNRISPHDGIMWRELPTPPKQTKESE